MTTDIFILGASGHAFDVADVAAALGYRPIFVTHRAEEIAGWTGEDPIVDEETALAGTGRHYAIGVGENRGRAQIAGRLRTGRHFPTLIHPDTSWGRGTRAAAERATGSIILAGARFTNNIAIGDFVTVNLNATVSHDVELGDFANLSPGAHVAGNVRIGQGAWLGIGAAVNQGTADGKRSIGDWTTLGSGAVATGDCEAGAVYVGVPARKVG